jgi:sugar lactone lactonase YvrE
MRNEILIGVALAALSACTSEPSPDETITIVHQHVVPGADTTTTQTVPRPESDCDKKVSGLICTYVGIPHIAQFSPESIDRRQSALYLPIDVTFNPTDNQLYLMDYNNHRIRTVLPDETVVTIAGTGFLGDGIFNDQTQLWEDGPAIQFAFNHPANIAFDPVDTDLMYISAWHNSRVERYSFTTKEIEFYAGTGARSYSDGDADRDIPPDGVLDGLKLASSAALNLTPAVTFDDDGELYLADQANMIIRKVDRDDGTISTIAGIAPVAGVAQYGFAGDGGDPLLAKFSNNLGQFADPQGRIVYHDGSIYVADTENQVIRKIDLTQNVITTVAGHYFSTGMNGLDTDGDGQLNLIYGDPSYSGDGGLATEAGLNRPHDIAFGPDGTMYIADFGNHCIRAVDGNGTISTFAGKCEVRDFSDPSLDMGDGGDPHDATFNHPSGIDVDPAGNVYVADQDNHVIRVIWK